MAFLLVSYTLLFLFTSSRIHSIQGLHRQVTNSPSLFYVMHFWSDFEDERSKRRGKEKEDGVRKNRRVYDESSIGRLPLILQGFLCVRIKTDDSRLRGSPLNINELDTKSGEAGARY